MKSNKKYIPSFLLIMLFSLFQAPFALGSNTLNQISYLDNELSANIENASLGSVISEIQAKTGIEFLLNEAEAGRTVSVTFQALPLEKALKRILKQSNHSMIFTANGDIQKVIIVASGEVSSGSQADRGNISSSFPAAVVTPPIGGMEVTPPSGANTIVLTTPSKRDMKVTPPSDEKAMALAPPGGDMIITPPSDDKAMVLIPPSGDMKVTPPSKSD